MIPVVTTDVRKGRGRFAGLVWTLIRTDFKTRYHGTIGGFVWALLKPLTMFLVLLGVFAYVFANDGHYKLDLIIGLFVYEFFQEATKTGLLSLRAKGYLLAKARFPSWVVVLTSASNAVITVVLFSIVLLTFLGLTGRPASPWAVALYFFYLLQLFAIISGFSLAASVLFMRFRDLNQVWEVITQAGFFVAPIVYPIGILPERLHVWLYVWPPTPIILFVRSVLLDGRVPSMRAHLLLLAECTLILVTGALIYNARAPRVAEEL